MATKLTYYCISSRFNFPKVKPQETFSIRNYGDHITSQENCLCHCHRHRHRTALTHTLPDLAYNVYANVNDILFIKFSFWKCVENGYARPLDKCHKYQFSFLTTPTCFVAHSNPHPHRHTHTHTLATEHAILPKIGLINLVRLVSYLRFRWAEQHDAVHGPALPEKPNDQRAYYNSPDFEHTIRMEMKLGDNLPAGRTNLCGRGPRNHRL